MFRLWMDSIHCYCIPDGQRFHYEVEPMEDKHDKCSNNCSLNPPVILVGTWKDKLKASTEEEVRIDYCIIENGSLYITEVRQGSAF